MGEWELTEYFKKILDRSLSERDLGGLEPPEREALTAIKGFWQKGEREDVWGYLEELLQFADRHAEGGLLNEFERRYFRVWALFASFLEGVAHQRVEERPEEQEHREVRAGA